MHHGTSLAVLFEAIPKFSEIADYTLSRLCRFLYLATEQRLNTTHHNLQAFDSTVETDRDWKPGMGGDHYAGTAACVMLMTRLDVTISNLDVDGK